MFGVDVDVLRVVGKRIYLKEREEDNRVCVRVFAKSTFREHLM